MAYTRPYGSGGFKDSPDTSTAVTAAALNTMDVGIANAHSDIAASLALLPSRNRIVNGACMVDQRNAGAAQTNTAAAYVCDRFYASGTGGGTFTTQRVQDGPGGVSAFSAKLTVYTADASIASGDLYYFMQAIEGYNVSDLGFGTASPQSFTLSFYVKSSVTGTFGGTVRNDGATGGFRSYPFTYAISAANTWERKTITITADASGTYNATNGAGLYVFWGLGAGSTYTGASGSWQAGNLISATGSTNLMASVGSTWQITGVQVEAGTVATRFEHRSYSDELTRCQRYYEASNTYLNTTTAGLVAVRYIYGTANLEIFRFRVEKRVPPTMRVWSGGNANAVNVSGSNLAVTGIGVSAYIGAFNIATAGTFSNASQGYGSYDYDAAAEL